METSLSASTLQERVKTPFVQSLQEREKTPCVQSQNVFIPDQFFKLPSQKLEVVPVGGRLPFRERPKLSRFPCISSGYTGSDRQNALLTSIQDLLQKGAIKVVHTKNSLVFYSRLFLVPKPGNHWRPVIDLSSLNKFLAIPKFKMETPESIRASLRKGEWVTSIDLTDTYLHVPIHTLSRKYLRFCHKGIIYQFTSLPFGLATAPLVFKNLVKEVKLIALQQEIRLHQYLDDWLIRVPSKQVCIEQTQKLLKLVKHLGFVVNFKKSELIPSQRFDFLGYHFFTGHGSCEAHTRQVDKTSGDVPSPLSEVRYQCKDSYLHHWIACINGEDCKTGQDTYETISVASQNSLEISDASGHTNSLESEDDTTWGMVVRPSKRATRRVSPPKGTQNSNLYRRLKRRMGRSLKSRIHRRALVSTQKTPTHQSFRTEGSFSGSTILQKELQQQLSPHSLRQHLRGVIHQQTGRNKISRPMRTDLENSYLVPQQQGNTQQGRYRVHSMLWRTPSPGGTRSSQQSGPFRLKYSRNIT